MLEVVEDGWVLGLEEDHSATFHLGIGLAGYSEEDGAGGSSTPYVWGAYYPYTPSIYPIYPYYGR